MNAKEQVVFSLKVLRIISKYKSCHALKWARNSSGLLTT